MSNMIISHSGLTQSALRLLNERVYSPSFAIFGELFITPEGIAYGFSENSYVYKTPLTLSSNSTIKIKFTGSFSVSDNAQCCWSLVGSSPNDCISLLLSKDELSLYKGSIKIRNILDISINPGDYIDLTVSFKEDSCSIVLSTGTGVYSYNGTLATSIPLNEYSTVNLGWSPVFMSYYWNGQIQLANFLIYENDVIVVSSSTIPTFKFEKVMLSDGTIPLSDSSTPILRHVYSVFISEVERTGKTIVFSVHLPEDIYLNIVELGLYATFGDRTILFSVTKGLSIRKTADLDYDLIFSIDLLLEVVNTTVMPKFKVSDDPYIPLLDLDRIRIAYADSLTDMERAIDRNSTLIGYNGSMAANFMLSEINFCQKNVSSVELYRKIRQELNTAQIEDFYTFSDYPYPYSLYYSKNLSGLDFSDIMVLEGSLFGRNDGIDFSNPLGFSLCVGVLLKDIKDKIILSKVNAQYEEIYFSLELKNKTILFNLYLNEEIVTLKKEYSVQELQYLVIDPLLITVIKGKRGDAPVYSLYTGLNKVDEVQGASIVYLSSGDYKIANYLFDGVTEENYVNNIISFNSSLSGSDIKYLVSVLGTY